MRCRWASGCGLPLAGLLAVAAIAGAARAAPPHGPQAGEAEILVRVPWRSIDAAAQQAQLRAIERRIGRVVERCGAVGDAEVLRVIVREPQRFDPSSLEALQIEGQPNFTYDQHAPDDPAFAQQWPLHNTGQSGGSAGADIAILSAWELTRGDDDVLVGVVDSGAALAHPDLAANLWRNPGEIEGNGVDDDANGYIDDVTGIDTLALTTYAPPPLPQPTGPPQDSTGHGTAVAGIIAAVTDNGLDVAGVAPQVRIIPCRMYDNSVPPCSCRTVACLSYLRRLKTEAKRPVVAVNFSFGTSQPDALVHDAIADLASAGILLVASAGSKEGNTDCRPQYPSSFVLPNLLAVTATNNEDRLFVSEANCGPASVHVAAPGGALPVLDRNGGHLVMQGTSMAAAHATGVLALLAAYDIAEPGFAWDWRALRNRVIAGGTPVGPLHFQTISQRRLRAAEAGCAPGAACTGALTCREQYVHRRLLPRASYEVGGQRVALLQTGTPLSLAALSINCEKPVAPVRVVVSMPGPTSATVELHDLDAPPAFAADDGVFAATWTPPPGITEFTLDYRYGPHQIDDSAGGRRFDHLTVKVVDAVPTPAACPCAP